MTVVPRVLADETALPFPDASFDAVVSVCSLHWVNDVAGTLGEVLRVLRPDGAFMCSFVGGSTLTELRCVWREGGGLRLLATVRARRLTS